MDVYEIDSQLKNTDELSKLVKDTYFSVYIMHWKDIIKSEVVSTLRSNYLKKCQELCPCKLIYFNSEDGALTQLKNVHLNTDYSWWF